MTTHELDYCSLKEVLASRSYALGLSPGFFRFYALTGALAALEQESCLNVSHISGSSAGALVGGFYASGWSPNEIIETLMSIKREDIWDLGGLGGLLQGQKFHDLLIKHLKVKEMSECLIPIGVTSYDILRFKTNCLTNGCLATAIRASCTFPGLFQPVIIDNSPHIDGGVFDDSGLMALPGVPESNLIVNIVCGEGREASSQIPEHLPNSMLLTIVLRNIPMVSPFSMSTVGPIAFRLSREATLRALKTAKVIPVGPNQWVSHIDGPSLHSLAPIHHITSLQQGSHHLTPATSSSTFITTAPSTSTSTSQLPSSEGEINNQDAEMMKKNESGKRPLSAEEHVGPCLGYRQKRASKSGFRRRYSSHNDIEQQIK